MNLLNPKELEFLQQKYSESMKINFFFFSSMIFTLCVVSYIVYFRFPKSLDNWVTFFMPAAIFAIYALVFGFVLIPKTLRFRKDIKENRKEVFIGKIQNRERRTYKNTENFFWTLPSEIKIEVNKEEFEKYADETILTIHYSPNSKFLLSVEEFK